MPRGIIIISTAQLAAFMILILNLQAIEIVCVIGSKGQECSSTWPCWASSGFRASLEGWVSVANVCIFNLDVCSLYTSGLRLLVWALGCDGQWAFRNNCLVLIVSSLSRWVSPGASYIIIAVYILLIDTFGIGISSKPFDEQISWPQEKAGGVNVGGAMESTQPCISIMDPILYVEIIPYRMYADFCIINTFLWMCNCVCMQKIMGAWFQFHNNNLWSALTWRGQ